MKKVILVFILAVVIAYLKINVAASNQALPTGALFNIANLPESQDDSNQRILILSRQENEITNYLVNQLQCDISGYEDVSLDNYDIILVDLIDIDDFMIEELEKLYNSNYDSQEVSYYTISDRDYFCYEKEFSNRYPKVNLVSGLVLNPDDIKDDIVDQYVNGWLTSVYY